MWRSEGESSKILANYINFGGKIRNLSNIGDKKLVEDQINVLSDIVAAIKNKNDARSFIENFFTDSEKLCYAQRMNIMRMLIKDFSYMQIKEKIKAHNSTIARSKEIIDSASDKFLEILREYKYKTKNIDNSYSVKLPKYKGTSVFS